MTIVISCWKEKYGEQYSRWRDRHKSSLWGIVSSVPYRDEGRSHLQFVLPHHWAQCQAYMRHQWNFAKWQLDAFWLVVQDFYSKLLWVLVPKSLTSLHNLFGCTYRKTTSDRFQPEKSLLLHRTRSPEVVLAPGLVVASPVPSLSAFSPCSRSSGQNPWSRHRMMHQHIGLPVSTFGLIFPTWTKGFFFRIDSSFRSQLTSDNYQ